MAAEDSKFYEHNGIDPTGIARAVWQIVSRRKAAWPGGSDAVARQWFRQFGYSYESWWR